MQRLQQLGQFKEEQGNLTADARLLGRGASAETEFIVHADRLYHLWLFKAIFVKLDDAQVVPGIPEDLEKLRAAPQLALSCLLCVRCCVTQLSIACTLGASRSRLS